MDQASQDFRTALQRARSADSAVNLELPILPGVAYDKVADAVEEEAKLEVTLLFHRGPEVARELLLGGFVRAAAKVAYITSAIG